MDINVTKEILSIALKAGLKNDYVKAAHDGHWRGDEAPLELDCDRLSNDDLKAVRTAALKAKPPLNPKLPRGEQIAKKITSLITLRANPKGAKIPTLRALEPALTNLIKPTSRKWVFSESDGQMMAYFADRVYYSPYDRESRRRAYVCLDLEYVERGGKCTQSVHFHVEDIHGGLNAGEILNKAGYVLETPDLLKQYGKEMERLSQIASQTGQQFHASGMGYSATRYNYNNNSMTRDDAPSKVVMDDLFDEDDKKDRTEKVHVADLEHWTNKVGMSKDDETDEEADMDKKESPSTFLPVHPYCQVFHLEDHLFYHVHVNDLADYKWDATLAGKLVLSEDKVDFVELIVESAGLVMEDIIAGKTGGVIALATGEPGLGKTLTAEIYSEKVKRPLYIVQCSQLGTDEEEIESELTKVLTRATRWGAVLLIDEADVYIRARGEDIHQNAIVGVFLRVLERYRGILWMTSNRATIIDDAILSRLTGHIRYERHSTEELKAVWAILSRNYEVALSKETIDGLVKSMPQLAGRNVKNLLKLARMAMKLRKATPDVKLFERLSKFQDLPALT